MIVDKSAENKYNYKQIRRIYYEKEKFTNAHTTLPLLQL